jgi:cell volume regulation protein A
MDVAPIIAVVGVLVFLGHVFSEVFNRTRIPDVLLLFLIGLILGPVSGIVNPSHFGAVGPVFTTVTLVVILFESGIGLRLDTMLRAMRGTSKLTVVNFFGTMVVVALIAWAFSGLDLKRAIMLGAIIGGTSSAVVIPLTQQLRLRTESRTMLILESAVSDVLCIVFALAILEAIKLGQIRFGFMVGHLISSFFIACLFGLAGAFFWSVILNRIRAIKNSIFTTPAFVFVVFGITEMLGFSGAIASFAFGVTLSNIELFKIPVVRKFIPMEPISLNDTEKLFFGEIVFLLKVFFFVYIGDSILLTNLGWLGFGLLLTLAIFLVRIPIVRLSTDKTTPKEDASLMAVIVPKGLAAAVLASIPLQEGVVGGEFIQNVTYAVVMFSIIMTSVLILLIDKTRLKEIYEAFFSRSESSSIQSTQEQQ